MAVEWPLVGRERELEQVARALASEGSAGVVFAGPGGVGKSRLAAACLDHGRAAGYRVERALATHAASGIPLGALASLVPPLGDGPDLLQRARQAVLEAAQHQPLLLLVDDAHLLDAASSALVLQVAADERVFVIATTRTDQPVPDAVTALWKDLGAVRIDLHPLNATDVEALLAAKLGGPVSSRLVDRINTASGGVPLAVRELVEAAIEAGHLHDRRGVWELDGELVVPDRIAELIGARLDRLSDDARTVITLLSLTEPLPLAAVDELGLTEPLAELEEAGLASVRTAGRRDEVHVRLAHPLYGEVARERLGELRRRDVYRRAAGALAATSERDDDRFRVVLWRVWAGEPVDPPTVVEAAERAYTSGDYARTLELAEQVWEQSSDVGAGHLLGFALGRQGRCDEAESVLSQCSDLATDHRDVALVAMARSENLFRGLHRPAEALRVCEQAEGLLEGDRWRDELVAHRAMLVLQTGDVNEALELIEPLLARDDDPRTFVKASYAGGLALVHAGRSSAALELAMRALPVHESVWRDDIFQTEPGVHYITMLLAMIEAGRLAEAQGIADMGLAVTRNSTPGYAYGWFSMMASVVAHQRGLVVTAERLARDGLGPLLDAGYRAAASWTLASCAQAWALRGDPAKARQCLAEAKALASAELSFNGTRLDEALGWTQIAEGEPELARRTFERSARSAEARGELGLALSSWHCLARAGGERAALDRVRRLAAKVDGPLAEARLAHVEALAERDAERLGEVAESFAALGLLLLAAEAATAAALELARRGDPRAAARWRRSRDEWVGECEGARTPGVVDAEAVEPLTAREREIARLAADRLSSKEIAERLGVSRRTVDNHLQRAYAKLGISGRADLAAALERGG